MGVSYLVFLFQNLLKNKISKIKNHQEKLNFVLKPYILVSHTYRLFEIIQLERVGSDEPMLTSSVAALDLEVGYDWGAVGMVGLFTFLQ